MLVCVVPSLADSHGCLRLAAEIVGNAGVALLMIGELCVFLVSACFLVTYKYLPTSERQKLFKWFSYSISGVGTQPVQSTDQQASPANVSDVCTGPAPSIPELLITAATHASSGLSIDTVERVQLFGNQHSNTTFQSDMDLNVDEGPNLSNGVASMSLWAGNYWQLLPAVLAVSMMAGTGVYVVYHSRHTQVR